MTLLPNREPLLFETETFSILIAMENKNIFHHKYTVKCHFFLTEHWVLTFNEGPKIWMTGI